MYDTDNSVVHTYIHIYIHTCRMGVVSTMIYTCMIQITLSGQQYRMPRVHRCVCICMYAVYAHVCMYVHVGLWSVCSAVQNDSDAQVFVCICMYTLYACVFVCTCRSVECLFSNTE